MPTSEILAVRLPAPLRRRLEFFASQFEFFEGAGAQFEYMTKDTLKLSGVDFRTAVAQESGKDRVKDLGSQTRNGFSVRTLMTALVFVKAMAWFRGNREVQLQDLRQIVPFVLHDKLVPHHDSPFFEQPGNARAARGPHRLDQAALRPGLRGVRPARPGPRRPGRGALPTSSRAGSPGSRSARRGPAS